MSGAELGLAIVGAVGVVDLAIKYCKTLIDTCSAFSDAMKEIRERNVRLQSNYMQMRLQLDLLGRVQSHLDEQSQHIQSEVLEILKSKLSAANAKLKSFINDWSSDSASDTLPAKFAMSKKKRSKYVLFKDNLDKIIEDVESWQRILFNPAWFVTMKVEYQQVDKELRHAIQETRPGKGNEMIAEALAIRNPLSKANRTPVFLPPDKLDSARIVQIAFSSIKSVQTKDESNGRLVHAVSNVSRKAVRDVVVKLRSAKPSTFGLLTCIGAVPDERENGFSLVFKFPEKMSDPETLRARMLSKDSRHSLTDRFQLATQLAQAICSIHTFGLVHKSIRPENIIIFRNQECALGSAFLLGFENIRTDEGPTRLIGDNDWEKNLYRHPQRQGLRLQAPYVMQHDIYSLGVCLLELGLWSSFVEQVDPISEPTMSQSFNFGAEAPSNANDPEVVKSELLTLARTTLPEKMGTKYSRVVETCLTCLDGGNEDFGDESEFQDQDGILVAVRYIEKISNISV